MVSLLGLLGGGTRVVELEPYAGDDGEGRPTYGAAVTASPARVEPHTKQLQMPDGRVVTLAYRVSVPGDLNPQPGDRLRIDGVPHRVETVDTPCWLDGTAMHHKLGVGAGS